MLTFLHAADIHLDSPLSGVAKYDGAPVDEIRGATRRALEGLVTTAIREAVAFVVIAGDLYDGDWRDCNTGHFFIAQMVRLQEANIPVYLVAGNHDAASRMSRSLPLPENVHVFATTAPHTYLLDEVQVALHGQSFETQCTTSDLASNYPPPVPGYFNIGVLHTSLSGRPGHASYAPCSEACLRAKGYDYWALGHIHHREILGEDPTIAYPGNIQGRHIRETGPKGCLLATIAEDRAVETRFQALDVFRWEAVDVDLTGVAEAEQVLGGVATEIRAAVSQAEGRPLVIRLTLSGATPLHRSIQADQRQLIEDIRAIAADAGAGRVCIERLRVRVTAPALALASRDALEGPLQEIGRLVAELRSTAEMRDDFAREFSELIRKLPPDLADSLALSDDDWWKEVLDEAEAQLVTRLGGTCAD
jgi:DNA repair exonuclease SbcCD nuclease subunit